MKKRRGSKTPGVRERRRAVRRGLLTARYRIDRAGLWCFRHVGIGRCRRIADFGQIRRIAAIGGLTQRRIVRARSIARARARARANVGGFRHFQLDTRSEEPTSELQSLMRTSY